MKKLKLLVMAALVFVGGMSVQSTVGFAAEMIKTPVAVPETNVTTMANKMAIRELVDTFSILADKKDGLSQIGLFTKDAVVENYNNGKLTETIKGNENIGKAFDDFLKTQDIVYHINGQQVVQLHGDKADGISYCFVTLVYTDEEGNVIKRQTGVRYEDVYEFQDGRWLIAHRKTFFDWGEQVPYLGV